MKNTVRVLGMFLLLVCAGVVQATTEWSAQDYDLYSGDFNGDGKSDILYIAKSPGMPSGIAISDSTGAPNTAWQSWASDYLGINWSGNAYNVIVADFNGDGKADIFLQSKTPGGNCYLLLTSGAGFVVAISQTIANGAMGLTWSADQHHIIAGDFNGDHRADLFLQATSSAGTNYVVLAASNGLFTTAPVQSWTDSNGPGGFKWSTQNANVFAGDFNGDGFADLLVQAKPNFVMIDFDVSFPVPTYPANMNGVVLSQGGTTPFIAAGAQAWSRMSNGVDWSPLASNVIIAMDASGKSDVILQSRTSGGTSSELIGNSSGAIFPSSATALSSNVSLSAGSYHLIAGNYSGSGVGLYYQALTSGGTNYVADAVGATTTASVQNPTTATRTVEPTAVGRTAGRFGVSSTGSAQYAIPIWAPPGPRGIQPSISLAYDSGGGIGPLGIGWTLSGLGEITRCNLTTAQDTNPAPVALVTTDGYCINGNRLRLTSGTGTYGTAGSTYQTEIADFSNITANGTAGNGPAYFTVQAQNGLTYQYGYTDSNGNGANSQVLASGGTAMTWMLSKVIDRAGNNYVINYTALTGTAVPSKILWTPVSAGSSSYAYTMQFNYTGNVPASSTTKYVAGTQVFNNQLLSSIQILLGSTVVKDYFIGYQASPITGREELISVQECADAAQSNCLFPTSIGYQDGLPGVSTVSNSAVSGQFVYQTRYDLNGDGYPDLVTTSASGGGNYFVAFGSASGYGTPVNTGIPVSTPATLFGNITGGHQDGILTAASGTWVYYTWNGSSFVGTSTGLSYDSSSKNYVLADINGDGLPDLVSQKDTNTILNGKNILTSVISTQLNTSTPTTPSFSSTLTTGLNKAGVASVFLQGPDAQFGKLRRYDFNGDGRDDLVMQVQSGSNLITYELISTGTAFQAVAIATVPESTSAIPVFFTNWNDDKCTDFVTSNTLYVSGCNGSAPQTYTLPGTILLGMDWDGDGRTDILVQNGSTIGVYLSQGTGTPSLTSTSVPYNSSCTYVWMDANGDGLDDLGCVSGSSASYYLHNGTSDLATSFADGYGNAVNATYVLISQSNYTEHGHGEATFPDQDYIGPLPVVSQATFSDPSAAPGVTYSQSFQYFGAWTNLQGRGFDGFGEIDTLDSRNGLTDKRFYQLAFPYTGMLYQETLASGTNGTVNLRQSTGTPAKTPLSTTANQQRVFPYFSNWTTSQWEVGGPENGTLITTTSTNYSYDNYGNATNIVQTVTDNDPGSPYTGNTWTTNTTNAMDISVNQSADLAAWCLNMLDQTQVVYTSTLPGSTSVTRTKAFTPDTPSACRIKTVITEPAPTTNPYKVTEALTFDGFGNIQTDTVTGNNMPSSPASRLTTLNWGTTGQFLNSFKVDTGTVASPTTATTSWNYSSNQSVTFGVPDSVTDPNGLPTSWTYDAFGRKSKEVRPDSTSTTWTWSACAPFCGWSNSFYQIAQTAFQTNGAAIRTDTNFYDPIDRVTEISGPTVTGSTANIRKLYNSMGLLAQQSLPFVSGATAYQQSFAYDALNRLVETERPVSASGGQTYCNPATVPPTSGCQGTQYSYAGRKLIVSDPNGNTKTTITDVNGWLRQTKDAIGYNVTRAFDAAGSLIGITDSVGNTLLSGVSYAYGLKPFRTAFTDADRGAWTYTVDSLGERIGWRDAKNQSFSETYDALSRPLTRTEPDLFTQWTWGSTPANHNVGQLISECTQATSSCSSTSALYYEARTFDSIGRLSTRAITEAGVTGNDPGGVFLFTSTYSATTGLPNTLTYPISTSGVAALNIQYAYQNGLLQSVTDTTDTGATCGSTCTLWTANAMNAFGQITQETLGNGVVTNRTYDAVTSRLSGATAGVGGGAALLNQSYLQDRNGNVIQRQQNNTPGITESFAYDEDNRLTCAALASTCTTPTLVYDGGAAGPGNITSQTGVGTYTYPAAGQPRPHAVTSLTGTFNGITNPSFAYDANGNMINRASSTPNVAWSSYNYPIDIAASDATGAEEVQLSYGPDRQRWKQIYTGGPNGTETTYYIGGLVDLAFIGGVPNYRHYINAGGEPVAVYNRTAAGNTMSYMLEDHQGSVSTIASNTGTADVNESFSAFGNRRDPGSWSGPPSTPDLNKIASLSRQGYTFQTWLGQSMGLNHMNGRVEDAILGRFLSPDPIIQDQSNSQNYNRYSYVLNNPLTFIDPTGFCGTNTDESELGNCSDSGGEGGAGGGGGFYTTPSFPQPTSLNDELLVLGHTCGNGFAACTSYDPPDAWQPTPSGATGAGALEEITVTASRIKPKTQQPSNPGACARYGGPAACAPPQPCGTAVTASIGGGGVAALFGGASGDVRIGFNSNGQFYFQVTGGFGGGAQAGYAGSVFVSTGLQSEPLPVGLSFPSSTSVLVQGVYGLGGGQSINVGDDGADFGTDTKVSAGDFLSAGSIYGQRSLVIATPTSGCTARSE